MLAGWLDRRGDLTPRGLRALAVVTGIGSLLALGLAMLTPGARAGGPLLQWVAVGGGLCFLVPFAFSVNKRSGAARRMPASFSAHALAAAAGLILISAHAGAGNMLSPPGLVWLLGAFLALQGLLARIGLVRRVSAVFASRPQSFAAPDPDMQARIAALIRRKEHILARLEPTASEALFSPNLRHGLRHPVLTLRYALLASREAHLVGRHRAGLLVAFWRRTHVALALLFLVGLLGHVVTVLFFAGYVAGDGPIDWWHITALGG